MRLTHKLLIISDGKRNVSLSTYFRRHKGIDNSTVIEFSDDRRDK